MKKNEKLELFYYFTFHYVDDILLLKNRIYDIEIEIKEITKLIKKIKKYE